MMATTTTVTVKTLRSAVYQPQRFLHMLPNASNETLNEKFQLTKLDPELYPFEVAGTIIDECIHEEDLVQELITYDVPVTDFTVCRLLGTGINPWGNWGPPIGRMHWDGNHEKVWAMTKRLIALTKKAPEDIFDDYGYGLLDMAVHGRNYPAVEELLRNPAMLKQLQPRFDLWTEGQLIQHYPLKRAMNSAHILIATALIKAWSPWTEELDKDFPLMKEFMATRARCVENLATLWRVLANENLERLVGEFAMPTDVTGMIAKTFVPPPVDPNRWERFFGALPPEEEEGGRPAEARVLRRRDEELPPAFRGMGPMDMNNLSPERLEDILEALVAL